MQSRLYIDEDAMARALVNGLRARGVDVETVTDVGLPGMMIQPSLNTQYNNRERSIPLMWVTSVVCTKNILGKGEIMLA
jgi:hypothetical protein